MAKCLGNNEQITAVYAVNKDTSKGGKEKQRSMAGKAYQAKVKGGIGQTVNKPAHGYLLHPCSDEGNALASEIKLVVSVAKSPPNKFES
jgi:hypothetical protein